MNKWLLLLILFCVNPGNAGNTITPEDKLETAILAGEIKKVIERYDALLGKNGVAKMDGPVDDRMKKLTVANAILPVLYSARPRMRGNLADWDDIPVAGRLSVAVKSTAPPRDQNDAGGWFKAAITDSKLMLLVVISDDVLTFNRSSTIYQNDCVEIFLDPMFTRRDSYDDSNMQIFVTAKDNAGLDLLVRGKIPVTVKPVTVKGGWGFEAAIPLVNDFFAAHPFDGMAVGFNISYNDNDNAETRQHKITWSGLDEDDVSWNCPAVFGALVVVSDERLPVTPVAPGRMVAENKRLRSAGETVADPSSLARERPNPPLVRGFMSGDLQNGKSFKDMREWGAGAVRLQLQTLGVKPGWTPENLPKFLDRLEAAVSQADKAGLKVVLAGFEAPLISAEPESAAFWHHPDLEKSFCSYWQAIAERMKPYKHAIWGYDLLNEPLERSQLPYAPKEWRALAIKIISAIRKVDSDTWIVYEVGPGGGNRGFEDLMPLPDHHVIYSFHMYEPGPFTHQGIAKIQDAALLKKMPNVVGIKYPGFCGGVQYDRQALERSMKPVIDFQNKWHVPIYVGEFSVVSWAPVESSTAYLADVTAIFQKYGWSWTYHAFREYPGWSLEHEDGVFPADGKFKLATKETERARVIKRALKGNINQ